MLTLGCSGFAVPATRYFKEFTFVELQETHVTVPGIGSIKRWKREAPSGFRFAMLAPREVGQENFRLGPIADQAINMLLDVGKEISATTAVFLSPPEFTASRANKSAVKEFMALAKKKFELVVWEPPVSWDPADGEAIMQGIGISARDPLKHGVSKAASAYYRMPGQAGYKSRYEDHAIDKLAALANTTPDADATYVFANLDMFADAKRFRKALGQ